MQHKTFLTLEEIHKRWPGVELNGKIIQLLLAISLCRSRGGFGVTCNLNLGVDLELVSATKKFAIEVKTTEGTKITLADKDIDALQAKLKHDGYIPTVAALPLTFSLGRDWVVCKAQGLTARKYPCNRLELDSLPELQNIVKQHFEKTVRDMKQQVLYPPNGNPLAFLNNVLAAENAPPIVLEIPLVATA